MRLRMSTEHSRRGRGIAFYKWLNLAVNPDPDVDIWSLFLCPYLTLGDRFDVFSLGRGRHRAFPRQCSGLRGVCGLWPYTACSYIVTNTFQGLFTESEWPSRQRDGILDRQELLVVETRLSGCWSLLYLHISISISIYFVQRNNNNTIKWQKNRTTRHMACSNSCPL